MSVIYPKIESTSLIQEQQETTLEAILAALGGGGGGSISDLTLDQGVPSPGKKGPMNQAVATTSAPSYSNLTVNPLSLTLTGALRVDGSGVTQPISGNVSAAQLGSWTVTANAGTNLNTSLLALDTSVNGILRAQGATTAGVTGPMVQGSVTTANPTYITGQIAPLSLTTSGLLRIDASGAVLSANVTVINGAGAAAVNIQDGGNTITVDGTVAVTQVTSPWVISGTVTANAGTDLNTSALALDTTVFNLQVNLDSLTSDSNRGMLILGAVTDSQPGYTDGNSSALSLTTRGLLRVDASGATISGNVNVTNLPTTVDVNYGTVGASTLRSAAQIGNATGAADFGSGNSGLQTLRVVVATNQAPIPVTQSGSWSVTANAGTNLNTSLLALESSQIAVQGTVAAGTAATKSELIGGVFNTSLPTLTNGQQAAIQLDASGRQIIAQATASALNAQVVGAVASGAANAGNPLKIGAVFNTTQPTVTNGLIVDLQTTNHGSLIVATGTDAFNITNITGTVSLPTGAATEASLAKLTLTQGSTTSGQSGPLIQGAVTTNAPTYTTAQTSPLSLTTGGLLRVQSSVTDTAPATQNITTQDVASTSTSVANGQVFITGSPTANSAASFTIMGEGIEVQVTGTWTGTLSCEISMDGGTTWITRGIKQSGSSYLASSFTQNFQGGSNLSGMTNYRVRATAAMTGTATVRIVASEHAASIVVSNPQSLRDSTVQSIMNTIKAASTAAVATDTALVVAISPNNSIATTTPTSATPTYTRTAASISSVTVQAAAATATKMTFVNDSTSIAYLKQGASASTTSYCVIMQPFATYIEQGPGAYFGLWSAIWVSATGSMQATSNTP